MTVNKKISPQGLTKSESYSIALQAMSDNPPSSGDSPPSSIVVTSGSYTIPNGYYAKVKANVWSGGYLNINGGTVLKSLNSSYAMASVGGPLYRSYDGDPTWAAWYLASPHSVVGYMASSSTGYNQSSVSQDYILAKGTVLAVVGNGACCVELYLE